MTSVISSTGGRFPLHPAICNPGYIPDRPEISQAAAYALLSARKTFIKDMTFISAEQKREM